MFFLVQCVCALEAPSYQAIMKMAMHARRVKTRLAAPAANAAGTAASSLLLLLVIFISNATSSIVSNFF